MPPLLLSHFTAVSALGTGLQPSLAHLTQGVSGLQPCNFEAIALDCWSGQVEGVEAVALPASLGAFDCRNNRLSYLALSQDAFSQAVEQARARYSAARIGLFLGTSTSGILETEHAYRHRDPVSGALAQDFNYATTQNTHAVTEFVRQALGLSGPALTISTACSSSAKVFALAYRMIASGWIDAAVVGGTDSLCLTALYGFHALELLSDAPCRPFDASRKGLSIGEASAMALLERAPNSLDADAILLSGFGESSDAYHMSTPDPAGRGAERAMRQALALAGLSPPAISYINLHGTATPSNDQVESLATQRVFGCHTPCSSTKGATGHTLGAAGALEAVICALALRHQFFPGSVNTQRLDPALNLNYLLTPQAGQLEHVLSNSFGFGGSNCSLIFSRAQ